MTVRVGGDGSKRGKLARMVSATGCVVPPRQPQQGSGIGATACGALIVGLVLLAMQMLPVSIG
jgi:hypothetical protein